MAQIMSDNSMPAADQDTDPPKVQIASGMHEIGLPVAGHSVGDVQSAVAEVLNVAPHAIAYVDGRSAKRDRVLVSGSRLEFFVKDGCKSALSKAELDELRLDKEVRCS